MTFRNSNVARPSAPPATNSTTSIPKRKANVDYFSFSNVPTRAQSPEHSSSGPNIKSEPSDWERLLGSIDGSHTNIFDNIYGGPAVEFFGATDTKRTTGPTNPQIASSTASTDSLAWNSPADLQWSINNTETHLQAGAFDEVRAQPESVFSLSTDDGSANNSEDLFSAANDWGSASSTHSHEAYAGIVMPDMGSGDEGFLSSVWETATVI